MLSSCRIVCALSGLFLLAIASIKPAAAETILVPSQVPSIQQAIDLALDGDTVLVAPGTYFENLDFNGKAITVTSEAGPETTIVDGRRFDTVVNFISGESLGAVLNGFTLQNGDGGFHRGGGIHISYGSSPTITNNRIINNTACSGIGINLANGSPIIKGNFINGNFLSHCTGSSGGGGIKISHAPNGQILENVISNNDVGRASGPGIALSGPGLLRGNIITGNRTITGDGGGIYIVHGSTATIIQNLIYDNRARRGSGVYFSIPLGKQGPTLIGNTIADNFGSQVYANGFYSDSLLVNNNIKGYTGIFCSDDFDQTPPAIISNNAFDEGGSAYGGVCSDQAGINGNISEDPLFVDPASGNYQLGVNSLAIDAGDGSRPDIPSTDFDGRPRLFDGDNDGLATIDMGAFEFQDNPVANAGLNQRLRDFEPVSLDGSASFDPDGDPLSYIWSEDGIEFATSPAVSLGLLAVGNYTFTLTVTDSDGNSRTDSVALQVLANQPPVADAGPNQTARVDATIALNGSASFDPDGGPLTYSWTLNGTQIATGATPTLGSIATGTHTIVLTVTDEEGASASDSTTFIVLPPNQAPVANAGPDLTKTDKENVRFVGTGSFDPDGTSLSYVWTLNGVQILTGPSPTRLPFSAGVYTIILTVTDADGASSSDDMNLTVHRLPVAEAGTNLTIMEGETATLDGSGSFDPEGGPVTYSWTVDGNEIATTPSLTVGPFTSGLHLFTLTVTDQEGASASDSVTVAVAEEGQEPVVVVGAIRVPLDQPTIQDAIDVAANGDTVLVSPGIYRDNINFIGRAITVTSEFGPALTVIDGSGLDSVATFGSGETSESLLSGFTLRNGDAWNGGGVRILSSSPTITGNRIVNNTGCSGIGIYSSFGSPVIEGNFIDGNRQLGCTGGGGGGIRIGGASSAQVLNNTISNNVITGGAGGGIELSAAGTPTIRGNVIRGNSISGISPASRGGGIRIINVSDALIVQNIITDNTADEGAGIYWLVPSFGRGPVLISNTITDNHARQGVGSALLADGFDAEALLVNNILAAPSGSALACGNFNDQNPPVLMSNNIFSSAGAAYEGLCSDQTGLDNISVDPQFVDAANGNFRLRAISLLIDAGNETAPGVPATDFDGNARVIDGDRDGLALVDIGAFEFQDVPVADAGPDQSVMDVDTVFLDGSGSFDPAGDALTFAWTLDGIEVATGPAPSVGPFAAGSYTITLTVTDARGAKALDSMALSVSATNTAPLADAGPNQTVEGPDIVTLDGSGSSDPDGDTLTYSWVLDGVEVATGAQPNVGPFAEGSYVFTLTVTDPSGATSSDSVALTIVNAPPVADAGSDQTIITRWSRKRVTLNASGSSDADGTIVSYVWRLNGSVLGNGVSIRPRLRRGTNTVVLTVTDEDGASSSDEVVIVIARRTQVSGGD